MNNLQLAVNHAVSLMGNSSNGYDAIGRSRTALMNPGMDHKRSSAWCEYGWKENLNFHDLYSAYRRGGLAYAAVTKLNGKCWSSFPEIIEGEEKDESKKLSAWEKTLKSIINTRFWKVFAEADKRRLVGRYAGILIHVKDNQKWNQPVTAKGHGIEKLTPAWANCLKVKTFESDINSTNYGQPTMWSYTESLSNGSSRTTDIHPDRVFIIGDYSPDAIGFLEPGYNALTNIEKVEGGSGESFLKNAARQLNINFDKEIDLSALANMYGVSITELQEKFNEVAVEINRGNDVVMPTQGATVTPLVTTVPDPTPTYNINLQTFSASVDIPSKIMIGNQQAERASTEDNKTFNARCQSYREMELSLEIEDFLSKLIGFGVINIRPFTVIWDDLAEANQVDKLNNAKLMSDINDSAIATGEPIFDDNEIRAAAGYDSREDVKPLPDEDPDDEVDNGKETEEPDSTS